jgi:hypothetical protein
MNFQDSMSEVLKDRRYDSLMGRQEAVNETGEAIANFINGVLERFFDFLSFDMPFSVSDNTVGMVAAIFSIAAIVVAAAAAYVFVSTRLRSGGTLSHALDDIFEEMKNRTAAELIELSDNAENRRIAVRYRYMAVILSLNERHIIVIEPSATNALILKQIKDSAPQFADSFSRITEAFHYTWFGHKSLGDEGFSEFNSAVGEVICRAS